MALLEHLYPKPELRRYSLSTAHQPQRTQLIILGPVITLVRTRSFTQKRAMESDMWEAHDTYLTVSCSFPRSLKVADANPETLIPTPEMKPEKDITNYGLLDFAKYEEISATGMIGDGEGWAVGCGGVWVTQDLGSRCLVVLEQGLVIRLLWGLGGVPTTHFHVSSRYSHWTNSGAQKRPPTKVGACKFLSATKMFCCDGRTPTLKGKTIKYPGDSVYTSGTSCRYLWKNP